MILRSLRIRHVRGIVDARYDDLSERLCLLHGPNESGKSTIVEALHFGLFESTRGAAEHKRMLRTWGGTEAPEVTIVFEDDEGTRFEVHKRFLDRPETVIEVGANVRLKGKAAEARLRESLGTEAGRRSGPTRDDLGIWPLLWVRQGEAGLPTRDALGAGARTTLSEILDAQAGAMLLGPRGLKLLDALRARVDDAFTPTGRPSGAHKLALDRAEDAVRRRDEARERYAAWRTDLAELRRQRGRAAALDDRVAAQQQVARDAAARARRAEAAVERLSRRTTAVDVARSAVTLARSRLERHDDARARLDAQAAALDHAQRRATTLTAELGTLDTRLRTVTAELDAFDRRADTLRDQLLTLSQAEQRDLVAERVGDLRSRIDDAEALETRTRALRDELGERGLTRSDADRLSSQLQDLGSLRQRVRAAAVQLDLSTTGPVELDGEAIPAGTRLRLSLHEPHHVRTTDLELRTDPADTELLARLRTAETALVELLGTLGVADESQAAARLAAAQELSIQLADTTEALTRLAPEGIATLRTELRRESLRLARIPDAPPDGDPDALRAELDEADAARARLRSERDGLHAARTQLDTSLTAARDAARASESEVASAQTVLTALSDRDALLADLQTAEAASRDAELEQADLQRSVDEAGGDDAMRHARDEEQALVRLRAARDEARTRAATLQATLSTDAASGRYEAMRRAEREAEQAQAEAAHVAHEAGAHQRALAALEASWRERVEGYAAPLREAVAEGIQLLFPGSTLAHDDAGEVVGLRTGDVVERFESLSGGTREQLGVLVRLGLARVLARGRRLPIILDDALVNADPERRGRMVEVLRRASDDLQILVFTCHEEDFDRLGAHWRAEVHGRPPRR